jgi:hypothetical protein
MIKALFIHHSTGANLLKEGQIRQHLQKLNPDINLWDHNYNYAPFNFLPFLDQKRGLSNEKGEMLKTDYAIPNDNTNPDGLHQLFQQAIDKQKKISRVLEYDLILFKSCFPVTKITTDTQLEQYKSCYESMKHLFLMYPDQLFIALTPPPLRGELTKKDYALRAATFANWLNNEFIKGTENVAIFDLFHKLADPNSFTLRKEYCLAIPYDSHPNKKANEEVGLSLANFLAEKVKLFFRNS